MLEQLSKLSFIEIVLICNAMGLGVVLVLSHLKKQYGTDHKFHRMMEIYERERPKESSHLCDTIGMSYNGAVSLAKLRVIKSLWEAYCDSYTCSRFMVEQFASEKYDIADLYEECCKSPQLRPYTKEIIEMVNFSRAISYHAQETHGITAEILGWS